MKLAFELLDWYIKTRCGSSCPLSLPTPFPSPSPIPALSFSSPPFSWNKFLSVSSVLGCDCTTWTDLGSTVMILRGSSHFKAKSFWHNMQECHTKSGQERLNNAKTESVNSKLFQSPTEEHLQVLNMCCILFINLFYQIY